MPTRKGKRAHAVEVEFTKAFIAKHSEKYILKLFKRQMDEEFEELKKAGPHAMMLYLIHAHGLRYMEEIASKDKPEHCQYCGKAIPWDCTICAGCANERGP